MKFLSPRDLNWWVSSSRVELQLGGSLFKYTDCVVANLKCKNRLK
jgi:hypothetical protein